MSFFAYTAGAILGFMIFCWVFRKTFFRNVEPFWKKELFAVLAVLIVGGLVAGLGEGEGGFENRVQSMLTLNGIISRIPAAVIYFTLSLMLDALRAKGKKKA